jgi:hypothetical protein
MRRKPSIYGKRMRTATAGAAGFRQPYRQAVRKARSEAGFTGLVSTR